MTDKLTVVMLVGGRGSRLAPYTDNTPKCLIDVAGKTLLERILDNLQPLFTRFEVNYVFLVDYLGNQVEDFVSKNLDIDAVFLYDKPGADQVSVVLEAKPFVTGTMLLYYGDTIIFTDMKSLPDYGFGFIDEVDDVSTKGYVDVGGGIREKSVEGSGDILVGGCFMPNGQLFMDYLKVRTKHLQHKYISSVFTLSNKGQIRVNHHISIDDPDDWAIANKYYKEKEK